MTCFTLKDIAGYEKEKDELRAIITVFRHYREYTEKGAYLPKGLILSGPPGVGKTLFAKVLAGEICAPFYYFDGAMCDSARGVRRLKRLFAKAQQKAPSVIFIDELNTFVGDRYYHTDYTKRNLSTLLRLIDGLDVQYGVFVVGASSSKDDLDEALLRSGRMDKHICLYTPDFNTRAAILDHFLAQSSLDFAEVDRHAVVSKTSGFHGADIKTLVNEVVMACVYRNIQPTDDVFFEHISRIANQDIVRDKELEDDTLWAMHDIGHLVVSRELLHTYSPISIQYDVKREGNTSVDFLFDEYDYDEYDEDDEDADSDEPSIPLASSGVLGTRHASYDVLLDRIAVMLGGIAAEEVMLHARYQTAEDDIRVAQVLVDEIFDNGMAGFIYANLEHPEYIEISQSLLRAKENKRASILDAQFARACAIIRTHLDEVGALYATLCVEKQMDARRIEAHFLRT